MKRCFLFLPVCCALAIAAPAARKARTESLGHRIERILNASSAAARAVWGIEVRDASSGRVLFEVNSGKLFVPASNTKLFTSALALARLGPDYSFHTRVFADGPPDASGFLRGNLRLAGGGDPSLDLPAIDALAAQVATRGVRRVEGEVIGDDTAYVWAPYPKGWEQDDTLRDYGAPVSALTINNNVLTLRVHTAGSLATVSLDPPLEYFEIDNRLRTGPGLQDRVHVERLLGSRQVRLWGTMSSDPPADAHYDLAIDDPALYAALAFRDALERRGIALDGGTVAHHLFANDAAQDPMRLGPSRAAQAPAGIEIARCDSRPLSALLESMDKNSINLYAEMVLREVARARRGMATGEAGLDEMRLFLREAGIADDEFHFADGSGLSDLNLVSPGAVVKLLRYMYDSANRASWISALPIGAQDGTLAGRFRGSVAARRIKAKTGTLGHASALSGYAESPKRGLVVFSIFANNYNCPPDAIRIAIDRIALALAE